MLIAILPSSKFKMLSTWLFFALIFSTEVYEKNETWPCLAIILSEVIRVLMPVTKSNKRKKRA